MRRAALALALVACASGDRTPSPRPPVPAPAATPTPAPDPWAGVDRAGLGARVAVLGASVSAGFSAPRVAGVLGASLDAADVMMFRDPWANGARQVDAARAHQPSLVVALDFLFWYAYQPGDAAARAASLERGLAELARLDAPLALGDLPDMRGADPRILSPAVVPPPDQLAALDARIRAWAAARPHTLVVPLSAWSARLIAGEPIEVAPGEVVDGDDLLFLDRLHVNPLGLWWMLDQLDRQLEAEAGIPADVIRIARP